MPDIVFLTSDLVFSTRVADAARRLGRSIEIAGDIAAAADACRAEQAGLLLLDLTTPEVDIERILPEIRSGAHPPGRIAAFGPHVHEAKLQSARDAGCDEVLTRGQFDRQMDAVIGR